MIIKRINALEVVQYLESYDLYHTIWTSDIKLAKELSYSEAMHVKMTLNPCAIMNQTAQVVSRHDEAKQFD